MIRSEFVDNMKESTKRGNRNLYRKAVKRVKLLTDPNLMEYTWMKTIKALFIVHCVYFLTV